LTLSLPIISVSLLIALSAFLVSQVVVPYTSAKSNHIWDVDLDKGRKGGFWGQNNIWYKGDHRIYWIGHFDSQKNICENFSLYFFDDAFKLTKRVDAKTGIWTGDKWEMRDGIIQKAQATGGFDLKKFETIQLSLPEKPEVFVRTIKKPEEMSYWQLKRYAEKVHSEGYDATEYEVDLNIKLAFPLLNVVMVLMGFATALGLKGGGTPLAVSLGIGTCFIYLVVMGFSRSLGLAGLLPPALSAWLSNLIFLLFGVYWMMRLET